MSLADADPSPVLSPIVAVLILGAMTGVLGEVKALDRDRQLMCDQLEQPGAPERQLIARGRARARGRATRATVPARATRTRRR